MQIILQTLLLIMDLDKDRLFVFINLRSYLEDKETFELFKTAVMHGFKMLLIDSSENQKALWKSDL